MCDRSLRHDGTPIERVRIDAKDFSLSKFAAVTRNSTDAAETRWVICGKHLCGGCTDFALQSAISTGAAQRVLPPAVCVATCCHHRCTWDALCGADVGDDSSVFAGEAEFAAVVRLTSWATGGAQVHPEMRRAGRAAKVLIDAARIARLRASGVYKSVQLVQYCSAELTEEFHAIVAF